MQSLKVMFISVLLISFFSASALAAEPQNTQNQQIPEAALKAAAAARAAQQKPAPDVELRKPRDPAKILGKDGYCIDCHRQETPGIYEAVSYTHLTLPTICSV